MLGHVRVCALAHRTLMPRCRTVLLESCSWVARKGDAWADKFDWSMLKAISIDKEALIEVNSKIHLLSVVLVEHSNVLVKIALVIDAMEALTRPHLAESVLILAILITYALVSH